jgi:dolichol-phosphate mannosyltransferase
MHRFLPALFRRYGRPVLHHPVSHHTQRAGVSKYSNLGHALVGITDLFGVIWLM